MRANKPPRKAAPIIGRHDQVGLLGKQLTLRILLFLKFNGMRMVMVSILDIQLLSNYSLVQVSKRKTKVKTQRERKRRGRK